MKIVWLQDLPKSLRRQPLHRDIPIDLLALLLIIANHLETLYGRNQHRHVNHKIQLGRRLAEDNVLVYCIFVLIRFANNSECTGSMCTFLKGSKQPYYSLPKPYRIYSDAFFLFIASCHNQDTENGSK